MQPSCEIGSSWFKSALFVSVAEIQPSTELPSGLHWDFVLFCFVWDYFVVFFFLFTKLLDARVGAEWKQSKGFNQCVDKCLGQVSYRVLGNSSCKNTIEVPPYLWIAPLSLKPSLCKSVCSFTKRMASCYFSAWFCEMHFQRGAFLHICRTNFSKTFHFLLSSDLWKWTPSWLFKVWV